MVRALGVKQHGVAASHEVGARAGDIARLGVLGYSSEGDVGGLSGGGKVVAHPDEIEVRGDKDQSACAVLVASCDAFHQAG